MLLLSPSPAVWTVNPSSRSKTRVLWPKPHNIHFMLLSMRWEWGKHFTFSSPKLWSQNGHDMGQEANQLKSIMEVKRSHRNRNCYTSDFRGIFKSLLRNSLPMRIFIFRIDYFINVFNLIQKKKPVVTNTSKYFLARKSCSVLFSACKIMDFCSVPPAIHLKNN